MSERARWLRFVERRRRELHDAHPCAAPTSRARCPKHRVPVPQTARVPAAWIERADGSWRHVDEQALHLSGICKPCRDELYEQLAAEYVTHKRGEIMNDNEAQNRRSEPLPRLAPSETPGTTLVAQSMVPRDTVIDLDEEYEQLELLEKLYDEMKAEEAIGDADAA